MSAVDKIETKQVKEETYADRMRKEWVELNERTMKLSKFFMTDKFKELPKRKQDLLYQQFEGMQVYLIALSQRHILEESDVN